MVRKWIVLGYGGLLVLSVLLRQTNPAFGGILLAAGLVHLIGADKGHTDIF